MKNTILFGTVALLLAGSTITPLTSEALLSISGKEETAVKGLDDVSLRADGGLKVSLDNLLDANATSGVSITTTSGTSTQVGSTSTPDDDDNVSVNVGSDVDLDLNSQGIAVMSASQVNSEDDLEVFESNIVAADEGLAKVKIDSTDSEETPEVKVVYKQQAKLFGLIPVTIRSKTSVSQKDSATEVNSRLAWWSFLVTDENYNKEELEAEIKSNPVIQANVRAGATAAEKAEIAEAIIAEVEAHASAHISTN